MNPLVDIAVAAARHAVAQSRPPAKLPASVVSVTATAGSVPGTATVQVDGTTTAVAVTDLVGVRAGNRVLVEFRPSGAAYVTQKIV